MNALAGKTVLITRAQHQAKQMSVAVKEKSGIPLEIPLCIWKVCLIGKFNILKGSYIRMTGLFLRAEMV